MIGNCGCGRTNTPIAPTRYKVLIDRGMEEPICRSCEQRVIGKVKDKKAKELRAKGLREKEIEAELAKLDEKVSDAEPTESSPAPRPAPAAQAATAAPPASQ